MTDNCYDISVQLMPSWTFEMAEQERLAILNQGKWIPAGVTISTSITVQ